MPRRIPNYPDAFYVFNQVASWGSYVSGFSVLIFIWVLIDSLASLKTFSFKTMFSDFFILLATNI